MEYDQVLTLLQLEEDQNNSGADPGGQLLQQCPKCFCYNLHAYFD